MNYVIEMDSGAVIPGFINIGLGILKSGGDMHTDSQTAR
jgi:hypothetical protein